MDRSSFTESQRRRPTHSAIGDRHARVFTRWTRLVMCSRLLPRSPLLALAACCSPWPCCSVACALPACAAPPATADAHVHFHLRHAASRPRRPAGAARHALPLPPAAHVRQGSMRGMRGMWGRHGGGRRGGREAARRRGLARVHTGGQERPKSDDEHTVGSLRRESAPGTRACVRSLSSTSPCDGDTTVSARVQTAVSTPCGGSTQGQRVRGHNRRAARRAQSALGLSYTPAFPAHAQAPPPHPLPGVRQVSRRQQRPRQRPHHGGAATAPAIARPSIPLTPCPPLRLTP